MKIKCPICGSEEVVDSPREFFKVAGGDSNPKLESTVESKVCLNCGYVMYFANPIINYSSYEDLKLSLEKYKEFLEAVLNKESKESIKNKRDIAIEEYNKNIFHSIYGLGFNPKNEYIATFADAELQRVNKCMSEVEKEIRLAHCQRKG